MSKWNLANNNIGLLWRMTGLNIILITLLISMSSIVIYNTACTLLEEMTNADESMQVLFSDTLLSYLIWISLSIIFFGSLIYFSIMKKIVKPIKRLARSTKVLQNGDYPSPIEVNSQDEIGVLTQNFNQLTYILKKNEHTRNKMITDMAHELRTPLSNINGYLEGLKNGIISGDAALYESLHKESERLILMINQLYELNEWNIGGKSKTYEKKCTRVEKLLHDCIQLFKLELDKKNIDFEILTEQSIIFIDEKGIRQAVINLVQNAIQYYQGEGKITLRGEIVENEIIIAVTGPGQPIPIDKRDLIFERFYRIDGSRNDKTGGVGLGLAIVKEIIGTTFNGNVGIESENNIHTFWFSIPRKYTEC
ncbi:sensor histidine kinase [Evansella cellulosilytica]|uniref:sensor histidine kinase n=1 Tax=Evansella cellulosilytica TaxID=1413 RepID=UPI0002D7E2B9|nr:HAMP domain-containing sensor histidine kinase [Evansella cellulosilytica]